MPSVRALSDSSAEPAVRGFLHLPDAGSADRLVLTHGAGSNCRSRLLVSLAEAFAEAGFAVLRCDLPYRQKRSHGPPFPGGAERDRQGLRRAAEILKAYAAGRLFLGGHSYGGRQASMLAAEDQDLADGLLLLSYPLHPPNKPTELRTAHFPKLTTASLFVHGSRDPFASEPELRSALQLVSGRHLLLEIEGAGHDLLSRTSENELSADILREFVTFFPQEKPVST